ncbi:hypothetical protein AB0C77_33580 [Streptomyces sp. NPDC048629]|uniref:hypothetical protein n=1 Tax=Streptomyces sp. NPDC048629 TaxID=3154824 RepID=UPI003449B9E4
MFEEKPETVSTDAPMGWFQAEWAARQYLEQDGSPRVWTGLDRAARDVLALTLLLTYVDGYDRESIRGRVGRLRHRMSSDVLWRAWCAAHLETPLLTGPHEESLARASRAWQSLNSTSLSPTETAASDRHFPEWAARSPLPAWSAGLRVARGVLDSRLLAASDRAALSGRAILLVDEEHDAVGPLGRLIEVVWHPEHLLGTDPSGPLAYRVALPDGAVQLLPEGALFGLHADRLPSSQPSVS